MLDNTTIPTPEVSLEDTTREALIPKLATVNHDPATCPTWDAFIEKSMSGNKSSIAFLQRAVGYALCGDTGEPCVFILHGSGVGKTTCHNVITTLLDRECIRNTSFEMAPNQERISNNIETLKGARLVTASDGELNERLIKRITGCDKVTVRSLYHESLMPKTNLFLETNHHTEIQQTGNARHEIHLIPFGAKISETEKDLSLLNRLLDELPGICDWAISGYKEFQKEGLGVKPATAEHRAETDILEAFLVDCCVRSEGLQVQRKDLYAAYQTWCSSNDERQATQIVFSSRLMKIGFYILRYGANGGRVWEGIELLPSADDVLE